MLVRELIAELQDVDPDMEVFVASDEEGNTINRMYEVAYSPYLLTNDLRNLTLVHPDDIGPEYDENNTGTALVVWPH